MPSPFTALVHIFSYTFALAIPISLMMNKDKKTNLSLLLLGVLEKSWTRSFLDAFERIWGKKIVSFRFLASSLLTTVICFTVLFFVLLFWLFWEGRLTPQSISVIDLDFGKIIVIFFSKLLLINFVLDFISTAKTYYFLKLYDRNISSVIKGCIFVLDLFLSFFIAVFPVAFLLFVALGVKNGVDNQYFSPIFLLFYSFFGGVASVFSGVVIFFISTLYMISISTIKILKRNGVSSWLNIEDRPVEVLGIFVAMSLFLLYVLLGIFVRSTGLLFSVY